MNQAPTPPEVLPVRLEELLTPADLRAALLEEARRGLVKRPRELTPRWLYDERGSLLFEEITRLPEYYPTRRERSILQARSREIAQRTAADTLVELGSGSSEKTRLLLDALRAEGTLTRFVPFDVSAPMLRAAAEQVAQAYPGLKVHAVVGDFERHLGQLPRGGRRLLAFLGGTVGNLKPGARARFLAEVAAQMAPGDTFLLGTDLLKDRARLNAAYNDSQGVTAAFNLNVLSVLDKELGADFDPRGFEHLARFDEENRWIEMLLRSKRRQSVQVRDLGLTLDFEEGELLRTEVSCKFERAGVEAELRQAGMAPLAFWTDEAGDFGLTLAGKAG